jgi:DHA1 family bicyclomycin/chloramphenicol resistance-like MFS transporter
LKPAHVIDSRREYVALAALLAGLSMLSPFSIDTFFPSFRAMQADLGVSAWQIQQTMTAYLLTYAFTVIAHGPLSDALGRRPVVLIGTLIYSVASLACMFAPNYWSLLACRALQGATAGAGIIVGRAVIRDLYDGPRAQKLMNLVSLMFGIAPAIAPVIGGWVHVVLGWRWVFGLLAVFGIVLTLATAWRLPETHPKERHLPFALRPIVHAGVSILRDRPFVLLAMTSGFIFMGAFCFIAAAPAVIFDHWHLSETQFAWLFLPIIAGFTLGAVVSGRLAGRMPAPQQISLGLAVTIVVCLVRAIVHGVFDSVPIWVQQVMLFGSALGAQLALPALSLKMLDRFPQVRGSAASMQSFIALLLTTATIAVMAPLLQHDLFHLSAGSLLAILLAAGCWRWSVVGK